MTDPFPTDAELTVLRKMHKSAKTLTPQLARVIDAAQHRNRLVAELATERQIVSGMRERLYSGMKSSTELAAELEQLKKTLAGYNAPLHMLALKENGELRAELARVTKELKLARVHGENAVSYQEDTREYEAAQRFFFPDWGWDKP